MSSPPFARLVRLLGSARARAAGLILVLILTLGVAAAISYEAWRSGRAQQAGAVRALSEYARFAALTYRQRVQARLYTSIVAVLRSVADARAGQPDGPLPELTQLRDAAEQAARCKCGPALQPTLYLRVTFTDRRVSVAGKAPSPRELAMLTGLPDSLDAALIAATDWDFATIYDVSSAEPRLLVLGLRRGPDKAPRAVYGFGLPATAFDEQMFRPPAVAPSLLPLTPAERSPNDSLLSVSLVHTTGRPFVATTHRFAGPYVSSIPLGGVAGTTAIEVALNPRLAPGVLIGGMPASRLPLLVALLGLCALLLTATIALAWRATEVARVRSDFVASVSHELRTPLAQVLLFGETLSFGRMTTRREVRRAADIIVGETRRLMQLVDNVLLFGRRERGAGKAPTELVSLVPVVRDVLVAFAPLAATADATLRASRLDPCVVPADGAEVRQLLLNLLDNAIKYGPRGQTVTIGVARIGPPDSERARIRVQDEGPGIPTADRDRVWRPFVRLARDIATEAVGSGIGLAVVHQIVERHGGSARVESVPGTGGACIVVELPGARAPASSDVSLDARRSTRDQASG